MQIRSLAAIATGAGGRWECPFRGIQERHSNKGLLDLEMRLANKLTPSLRGHTPHPQRAIPGPTLPSKRGGTLRTKLQLDSSLPSEDSDPTPEGEFSLHILAVCCLFWM